MTKEIKTEKKEQPVSPAREAFAALIEVYKKQNPAKFEAKKASLEAKLETL